MAFKQRDNSGALFKNKKKETDNHPNLTGNALIGGVEYWVSGWTKETDGGEKWISLAFKVKEAKPQGKQTDGGTAKMRDDIPF